METPRRYAVAVLAGVAAAGLSVLLARSAVETGAVTKVSLWNGLVWTVAAGAYLGARAGLPDRANDGASSYERTKWDGLMGAFLGLAASATVFALDPLPVGLVMAVTLLFAGVALGGVAAGIGTATARFERSGEGTAPAGTEPDRGDGDTADD